jgi:hypothetical protein
MMDDPKIRPGDEISEVVPVQDARAAEKTGRVRVILIVSFALAVICLGAIVIGFAGGA